jgi:predicted Zn-dependent peptidase
MSRRPPINAGSEPTIPQYQKTELSNGMTLVAEWHPYVRSVSIGVWVKVGSSFESKPLNGISHFIEHMVFKGTESRNPLQIATALESLGGDLNAFTDREFTCYHATVLQEHVEVAFDILSDLLVHPTFPKEEMERERKVLLQELSMVEETPDDCIGDEFFATIWKGEPLGQSVIGTRKSIQAITRSQLIKFFRQYYRAGNIVLSVAGNVPFGQLRELAEKYFSNLSKEPVKLSKRIPSHYQSRQKSVVMNTEQLHLLLGFESVGFRDPFRFDALILSFFLGGGMSSRLFQEIREKAALAYTVDCECIPFSDTGAFSIYVAMAPRSLKPCLEILAREVDRVSRFPLTEKDLNLVKGQLKGTILLSNDQMDTRQESLGRNEIVFGRYISVEEVIEELQRVSPDRVQALAQRIFVRDREAVVTLGKNKVSGSVSIFK